MQPNDLTALCKRLATDVMGWHYAGYTKRYPVYVSLNDRMMEPIEWSPTSNIAQAFMVAEKIGAESWVMHYNCDDQKQYCCIFNPDFEGVAATPALAICLAADSWLRSRNART